MSLCFRTSIICIAQAAARTAAFSTLLIAQNAMADVTYPKFTGTIDIDMQYDDTIDGDDVARRLNGLYTTTEPEVAVEFQPGLTFLMRGELESLEAAGNGLTFEDQGFHVEAMNLSYDSGRFLFLGGKFSPIFGFASKQASGVYDTDFTADYQITEQIGLQGAMKFDDLLAGAHRLTLSTFFVDTTYLGATGVDSHVRTRKSVGGVGNTESLNSFTIALDGGGLAAAPGFSYHLAHLHRAAGRGDATDERAVAIGGQYRTGVGPISLTGLAEAVRFSDYGGERDVDRDYFTVGLQLGWESWHGAVFGTSRRTDGDSDDQILQISAGHEFDTGMALNLGWKTLDEGGENTNSFGIFLTYGLKF